MSGDDYNDKSIDAVLARIEVKVDSLLTNKTDHENRIAKLEAWKWKVVGIAIGAGAAPELLKLIFKNH